MDRDAGMSDREDEARQGDTGMIGSESEEPGPGRDTSLTEPDPVTTSADQPRGTVAMSEGDPMRTRLGSHVEGAGVIGYDVTAAEEGATQRTPPDDRPAYESEAGPTAAVAGEPVEDVGPSDRSVFADEPAAPEHPAFATEDAGTADRSTVADDPASFGAGDAMADRGTWFEGEPGGVAGAGYEGEPGGAGMAGYQEGSGQDVPATYTGEEADVTGRPEYAEQGEGGEQALSQEEIQRVDRPGGGGSLFTDEEPERLDRPGPQEPGDQEGVFDQEADRARDQRPDER